jgi:3-phenylpropionate/trans-cinnamate dioxygenase ferredoxin subunit
MPRYIAVALCADLPESSVRCVEVDGRRIALFHLNGRYFALADACTHRGGPLSEGRVEDDEVVCPWHGARFDIRTGRVTGQPAIEDVATFQTRVVGGEIEVELP